MQFEDRRDAGQRLGRMLAERDLVAPVVLALPRGGVPVGVEVAAALDAPLEVLVARKVGAPGRRELGVGAIAEHGAQVWADDIVHALGLTRGDLEAIVDAEQAEMARRVARYRGDRPLPDLQGRTAVVVDDGLATGVTAAAALQAARSLHPRHLVLAVPVAAPQTAAMLGRECEVVCVQEPPRLRAVGMWYRRFPQVADETVVDLLARARSTRGADGAT